MWPGAHNLDVAILLPSPKKREPELRKPALLHIAHGFANLNKNY